MLTIKQVKQLKKHSKEAVESLPNDHPWIHYLGSLDALCDTALKLYASMNKKEVKELQDLFDGILCLAVEGPEVATKGRLLEAIRKEAITGYNLCKQHLSGESQLNNKDMTHGSVAGQITDNMLNHFIKSNDSR